MKRYMLVIFFAFLFAFAAIDCALAAPLGNDDVIGLLRAGLSEATVLQAIDSADPPQFDTTATGLISLKKAGASDAVIQRVLARQSGKQPQANAVAASRLSNPSSGGECVSEVPSAEMLYIRASDKLVQLPYQSIKMEIEDNALAAVLTAGIVSAKARVRARLDGTRANVRIHDKTPVFLDMLYPVGLRDVEKLFYLMRFEIQSNSRVVEMAQTEGGIWSGVDVKDVASKARIPVAAELVSEQCIYNGKPFAQYRIRPAIPLEPGEYAYIEVTQGGLAARVFDFGVDK